METSEECDGEFLRELFVRHLDSQQFSNVMLDFIKEFEAKSGAFTLVIESSIVEFALSESMERYSPHLASFARALRSTRFAVLPLSAEFQAASRRSAS